jgi:hypothetical protein
MAKNVFVVLSRLYAKRALSRTGLDVPPISAAHLTRNRQPRTSAKSISSVSTVSGDQNPVTVVLGVLFRRCCEANDPDVHRLRGRPRPLRPTENFRFTGRRTRSAPLVNDGGIFLIYDGGDEKNFDRTGWVRFDKVIPRTFWGWLRSQSLSRCTTRNGRSRFPTQCSSKSSCATASPAFSLIAVGTSTWV